MHFSTPRMLSPANGSHHFFGYYGICPWDATGRYFACLETDFHDHMPVLGETARIILIDLHEGTHRVIAETKGWNFQQGTMLHWLPSDPSHKIIFNDCGKVGAFSRILDVFTGEERTLPRPVNAVGKTKDIAACLSFARLRRNRKVTSYPCANEYSKGGVHPDDDGIFIMDLQTGDLELVISLDEIWKANPQTTMLDEELFAEMGKELWFNHVAFNEKDTRFHFLARYSNLFSGLVTSMWTCGVDGSDPFLLVDFYHGISHFEWVDDKDLIVTMNWPDKKRMSHVQVTDRHGYDKWKPIAQDVLTWNGHPPVSPDKKLMATDTYIIDGKRHVYIVERNSEVVHEVATFENPPEFNHEIRCDPHPRWNRDGTQLSFDGLGEQGRQVYVIDVDR